MKLGGITDNSGNSSILNRLMTTKFPAVCFLAEITEFLRSRHVLLDLEDAAVIRYLSTSVCFFFLCSQV